MNLSDRDFTLPNVSATLLAEASPASVAANTSACLPIDTRREIPGSALSAFMPALYTPPERAAPAAKPRFFTIPFQRKLAVNNLSGEYHLAFFSTSV